VGKLLKTDLKLTKMVLCKNPNVRQLSQTKDTDLGPKLTENRVLEELGSILEWLGSILAG
jgi:hypothetical protein